MKLTNKTKIVLHLLFPLVVILITFIFPSIVSENKINTDVKQTTVNSFDVIKGLFRLYFYISLPHYIAFLISLNRNIGFALLKLLGMANTVLIGFYIFILYMKYTNHVDIALLWVFYVPISMFFLFVTWLYQRVKRKVAKDYH